jgi:hypothetical protein
LKLHLPLQPIDNHLMAPMVGHLLPSANFVESTKHPTHNLVLPSNAHTSMQGDSTATVQAAK